jgi:uncharacterized protein (TIGR02145 family)
MKQITFFFAIIFFNTSIINAQTIKVAVLDFENTSGIAKYDGLGKAMSSMLITDIEANVSPKRLQLVERSQIQKILTEQNFQASSAVDKSSSVKAGKLLGVKYLLVGDIYILNDVLVINARLTDTETGDIKFSKKQEGKLVGWLTLKTNIAKDLASAISMPFTEPTIADKEVNVATLTTFGNAIAAKDEGKLEKAEELISTVNEFSPDFKYLDDLKSQLDELKKQVEKNTADIKNLNVDINESIEDPYGLASTKLNEGNNLVAKKYFQMALSRIKINDECRNNKLVYNYYLIGRCNLNLNKFDEAITYLDSALLIYPEFLRGNLLKIEILLKQKNTAEAEKLSGKIISFWKNKFDDYGIIRNTEFIERYGNLLFVWLEDIDGKSSHFVDCYEKLVDFSFNSRPELAAAISQVYADNKVEFKSISQDYLTMRNRLLQMHSDFDTVLLANREWIKEYFILANSIANYRIKRRQYKEAKEILIEHIIRLANIDYSNNNTQENKYRLPERKESFSSGYPHELMGFLLVNLATTYIGLNQPEKAKIVYSSLRYEFLRISGSKVKIKSGAQTVDYFWQLFEEEIKELGFTNINMQEFKNNALDNNTIALDSFGLKKLTIKKSYEDDLDFESNVPQVWMTENLNVKRFRNGDEIEEAKNEFDWLKAMSNNQPVWCYYNFDPANGDKYGALYNIFAVIDSRGLAPKGYHIPTIDEFERYEQSLGRYYEKPGRKLMSKTGWLRDSDGGDGNGTNESNFNGLPGGEVTFESNRLTINGDNELSIDGKCSSNNRCFCCKENNRFCHGEIFSGFGRSAYFWIMPDKGSNFAYYQVLGGNEILKGKKCIKKDSECIFSSDYCGFSVRCLKD